MKSNKLRIIIPVAVVLVISIAFVANLSLGTLSAIGWEDIVLLCPLGALGTMLASKLVIPQAVISLVFAVLFIVVVGRAFCSWICPVPLVSRLRNLFKKDDSKKARTAERIEKSSLTEDPSPSVQDDKGLVQDDKGLVQDDKKPQQAQLSPCNFGQNEGSSSAKNTPVAVDIPTTCGSGEACSSCSKKREAFDSRHLTLGGSLLSAAIFGFPVFCLVCPIGLSFATIFLVIRLFALGDVTWSLLIVPALLVFEVVLFKKWCHKICPLSAFMSLVGKLNKTFEPTIDDTQCLETAKGKTCGICAKVCPEDIDPRHPERGKAWSECTKCRACVDACPTKSISMPLIPQKKKRVLEATSTSRGDVHNK